MRSLGSSEDMLADIVTILRATSTHNQVVIIYFIVLSLGEGGVSIVVLKRDERFF